MEEHQEHFGIKFYKDKKTGYWMSTTAPRIRAHKLVWQSIHGKIPKGMHIHHKDGNKSNNDILNLSILSASDHIKLHHKENPERKKMYKENADKVRHLTKAWHSSPEGIAWHKFHALQEKFGRWKAKEYNCKQCFKNYLSTSRSNPCFCSNPCKSKWRRESGLDNIERACLCCKKIFLVNKYSKTKNCSRKCGHNKRFQKTRTSIS